MIATYYVYRRKNDDIPVVSQIELPEIQMRGKKKYSGKKAKIEAIFRLLGEVLPEEWTTKQVNDYIGVNLFNTSKWKNYHSILNKVLDERVAIAERFEFQYKLLVSFRDKMKVGEQWCNTDPADDRIIYFVTKELMGEPVEMDKGLVNPIVSLKKVYDNGTENP